MPWKKNDLREQRYDLIRRMKAGGWTVSEVCRRTGVSRKTAYKWKKRYEKGRLKSQADQSRVPQRGFGRTNDLWLARVRRRTWGSRKLRYELEQKFGAQGLPGAATITRWLKRWGLAGGQRRRKPGPVVHRPALRRPHYSNEVWTEDFKGWYLTGDGTRVEP